MVSDHRKNNLLYFREITSNIELLTGNSGKKGDAQELRTPARIEEHHSPNVAGGRKYTRRRITHRACKWYSAHLHLLLPLGTLNKALITGIGLIVRVRVRVGFSRTLIPTYPIHQNRGFSTNGHGEEQNTQKVAHTMR